jgi:hypothetical protein
MRSASCAKSSRRRASGSPSRISRESMPPVTARTLWTSSRW